MYIVSACLLGANCKYNGGNNDNETVKDFCEGHKVIAVCPETVGGLKAPRPPAEQVRCCGNCKVKIVNKDGKDLTEYFIRGAEISLEKVMECCGSPERGYSEEPELAILKANSPSCGSGKIYDGTFTGTLTDGDGVFAGMLKARGIEVISEEELEKRLAEDEE